MGGITLSRFWLNNCKVVIGQDYVKPFPTRQSFGVLTNNDSDNLSVVISEWKYYHLLTNDWMAQSSRCGNWTGNFPVHISSSSSSCRAISTHSPDHLSPLLPIVQRFWLVRRATSCILIELLYVGSSWSPYFWSATWVGTVGEHHLWPRPCFSSSVLHVWFV